MFFFLFLFLSACGVCLLAYMFLESRRFELTRREVKLAKKPAAPIKILHLSDIHFSGVSGALSGFFDRLGRETYDFVFITGDIFDSPAGIPQATRDLAKLKARHGVYAVLGNHDYFDYRFVDLFIHNFLNQKKPKGGHPTARFEEAIRQAGVRILKNESVRKDAPAPLTIYGLDDPTTGRANVRLAMKDYDTGRINILLTHSVDAFLDIGEGEVDLSFSGHSHGGQVRLPVYGPVLTHTILGKNYADGLRPLKGAWCLISRGMGTSRFAPFRLLCRPEAIELSVS